ncbi:tonB-dependent hemoglobin/transferrin/lactoferrin receptor family protein, partial [Vibrio parahaemolyticus VP2007-007]
NRRL